MNTEDPISYLDSYYKGLRNGCVPEIKLPRPVKWWEAAGGLAAGVAVVVVTVSICLASGDSIRPPVGGISEHQLRMAGIEAWPAQPPKRVQRTAEWHI